VIACGRNLYRRIGDIGCAPVIILPKGRRGMISNLPLRIASYATAMWLVMFMAVPAARAQNQQRPPRPAPAAAPASKTTTIKYVCVSTDSKQPSVYLSEIFDIPDTGSVPDNFIAYERAKIAFQIYLVDTYKYPDAEDLVDCGHNNAATTAEMAAAMAAMKQNLVAQALAAKKRVVETGWKYTKASSTSAAAGTRGQGGGQQVAPSEPAAKAAASGPLLDWHIETKKDALTDEVSTNPASTKFIAGTNGKLQGFVTASAYCSSNGVSVFFLVGADDKGPSPSFPWYSDNSRGADEEITDVRIRVDDRPVHVAQGFPEVEGHQVYTNTLGLLFYEPRTFERAVRDQQNSVTTGVPALDGLLGGIVKQAAQSNVQTWQSSAAGPLSDLVNARSIRVELPVTTFDPKPLLDLNPHDPVFHKFVNDCNAKFTR
jgi:hypothetical protein